MADSQEGKGPVVRIGVAGLGRAAMMMIPAIVSHSGFRIAGVAEPRKESREAFAADFDCAAFADAADLCASPEVDAVYFATPMQFHRDHAVAAAEHGKHVLLEKPMAFTLQECDDIVAAVERNGVRMVVGHTHSHDPVYVKMREVISSGELGKLGMINTWDYTDYIYRARRPEELDTAQGGGIVFNQTVHQVDMVRLLGGGMVRTVRGVTGVWDPQRPTEGSCLTFLEFEDGAAASVMYNGYDFFDSDEFHQWIGAQGRPRSPDGHGGGRKSRAGVKSAEEETALKAAGGYRQGINVRETQPLHQPHFGVVIASCERGDLRVSLDGVLVYGVDGVREITLPRTDYLPGRGDALEELHRAVVREAPVLHDGRWAKATMEVCWAVLESARERREVQVHHQVPSLI